MKHAEIKLREHMSEWRFWMIIAYIGLVGVLLSVVYVNSQTSKATARVARDEAVHQAEISAATAAVVAKRKASVTACMASRPELLKINKFVRAIKTAHEVLAQNSKASLDSLSPSDPQYPLRLRNYRRIAKTLPPIEAIHFPVPTPEQCRARG